MASKNPSPDERVIYLALKNVFKGNDAGIRQIKAIQKLIRKHDEQDDVAVLVREHNFDIICQSTKVLLSEGIFASTLKAKIRFPELFDLSPTQSAEREASEAEAAKNEAEAIESAVQGRWDTLEGQGLDEREAAVGESSGRVMPTSAQVLSGTHNAGAALLASRVAAPVTPFFPVYLPFKTQHGLLLHLQTLLEAGCYDFERRIFPDLLEARGWDCAESVELNFWTMEFLKRQKALPNFKDLGNSPEKLFRSIANIRHTAVHRIPVTAKGIEQFLVDAETLAVFLRDPAHVKKIAKLRRETKVAIEELERNKHFLRSRLEETLGVIAAQRAELQRMEQVAIAEVEREDKEYQILAGKSVDGIIAPSDDSFSTAIETERETGQDDTDGTNEDNNRRSTRR